MWLKIGLVAAGGALGSSARYLTSLVAIRLFGTGFPAGTLIVNLAGCLLIGLSYSLAERTILSSGGRLFFMTGVLGGLTTFSTYALETVTAALDGSRGLALGNIALNNGLGLVLVVVGIWLGRAV